MSTTPDTTAPKNPNTPRAGLLADDLREGEAAVVIRKGGATHVLHIVPVRTSKVDGSPIAHVPNIFIRCDDKAIAELPYEPARGESE